jgi:hypothetical protein
LDTSAIVDGFLIPPLYFYLLPSIALPPHLSAANVLPTAATHRD